MTKFAPVVLAAILALALALVTGGDVRADDKETELQKVKKELDDAKKRIADLEENAKKAALQLDETGRLLLQAQRAEKLGRERADLYAKKVEELSAKLAGLRAGIMDKKGTTLLGLAIQVPPPPVLNVRGEITDMAGDLLTISIGIDAGLQVGSGFSVSSADGKRNLGTAKVTDAFNLYPKQAIVKFVPARDVPLKDLKLEELPKKGDVVRSAPKAKD